MLFIQILTKHQKTLIIVLLVFLMLFFLNGQYFKSITHNVFKSIMIKYLQFQTRNFESLKGDNFIIKFTEKDYNSAKFILNIAEDYFVKVQSKMGYQLQNNERILLVVYPDEVSLNKSFGWAGDKSAVGVYWTGSIRLLSPYAWLKDSDQEIEESFRQKGPISHELVHLLIDQQTKGNYTRWLTEGLAQYIEKDITGFTLDEPSQMDKKSLYLLDELDKNFDSLPKQTLAYWQSLEIIRYLVEIGGIDKIQELLSSLEAGDSIESAVSKSYMISLQELEERIKKRVAIQE